MKISIMNEKKLENSEETQKQIICWKLSQEKMHALKMKDQTICQYITTILNLSRIQDHSKNQGPYIIPSPPLLISDQFLLTGITELTPHV